MPGSPRKDKPHRYSRRDFEREFPTDDACLEWLWRHLHSEDGEHAHCSKCDRERRFHRVASRKSYSCDTCGRHVHPTAGTIFAKSTTPLKDWFLAIFLLSATRCGVSAKALERELGVTYKTAWRMHSQIRKLLAEDVGPLSGEVEADETFVGGKARAYPKRTRQEHAARKTVVFGAVERGGRIVAKVIPSQLVAPANVRRYVLGGSTLFTDQFRGYHHLNRAGRYSHHTINHEMKIYVEGNVHTQTIDGFFGLFKTGIRGTHHSISRKHLQSYLDAWIFRYNHRDDGVPMFKLFLANVSRALA
jgi:transposase-like protein